MILNIENIIKQIEIEMWIGPDCKTGFNTPGLLYFSNRLTQMMIVFEVFQFGRISSVQKRRIFGVG